MQNVKCDATSQERFNGVTTMKSKTLTKIMSSVLCAALTMQIGWALKTERVNAAIDVTYTPSADGYIVNLTGADNLIVGFEFTTEEGKIKITYTDDADVTHFVLLEKIAVVNTYEDVQLLFKSEMSIDKLVLTNGAFVDIGADFTCSEVISDDYSQIYINSGTTFECDSITANNGSTFILTNYSTAIMDSVDLSEITYSPSSDSTLKVTTSFNNGSGNIVGTVIAERYTDISSDGGSFTLKVGEATKEITSSFSKTTPAELFDKPFTFGTVSDLYYGQDYDFSDLITVTDGYDKSVYLEYSSDGVNYSTTKPTAQSPNNYYVHAVAPDSGTFLGTTSASQTYKINYLGYDELYKDGEKTYSSVSGIVNGKYVPGNIILSMPDGIFIRGSSFGSATFSDKITLTPDDVLNDYGGVNYDALIQLRNADDATTNGNISIVQFYPEILDLVFDLYDPTVFIYSIDGEETDLEDNDEVTGDEVKLYVYDENIKEIYINGNLYESYAEGYFNLPPEDDDSDMDFISLTLTSVVGKASDYTIKVVDYAGRETTYSFTLNPNTADADISVSVPRTIYAGDNYSVDVKTNSDGDVTLQYKDASTNTVLSSKPTTAGKYTVTATAKETDFFFEAQDSTTYTIIKRTPDTTVTVPDVITIDSDYTIDVDTDSDGDVTYQYYNKNNTSYPINKPTTAGEYTVTVKTTETSKYYASETSADFTISKKSPSVALGVGTPYVGTTYKPTFYSNSDAADKAVFEYKEKNADDTKYSTTIPTAYGEYVVRVTIPETAEFVKTTFTADYKIIYLDAPQTAYVVEGQAGKNNYFVSDVELKAPTGYTISAVYGGPYTASIPYKDGITSVYLKRTSDGALTNGVPITNAPMVDKSAPSISAKTGTITPGSVMYVSDFTLNVSDPNLRSLKVNGETIDLSNYKNGFSMTLNPGYGSETYKIMAEDAAGNVTTIEFTLKAEWLKDKVIIPDVVLPLEGNESYNLDDGYWLVTRNTPEGPVTDKTVYNGNMPFYVAEGGDYTFTKVT